MTSPTRERLLQAALVVVAREGIAGASARVIAAEADVNQALVFYHHGSVDELLATASHEVTRRRAERYTRALAAVSTFGELTDVARTLHAEEQHSPDRVVLTQLLAGARTRPIIAAALRTNMRLLEVPVEATLHRLVSGTALDEVVPIKPLARTVAAGFLGLELLDGVVTDVDDHAEGPFAALEAIAGVVDLALQAGVIEAAVLRRRLRRAGSAG